MRFEINSLHEIGDIASTVLHGDVKIIDIKLEKEYERYCVKYLVEYDNGARGWLYEWSIWEVK